jgi:hypothetical protein
MPSSTVISVLPVGPFFWLSITVFAMFFIFLWKGGIANRMLALVLAVMSMVFGITPQYYIWNYGNQTTVFTTAYIFPESTIWYQIVFFFEMFMIIMALVNLMLQALSEREGDD